MAVAFHPGQELTRGDLDIFLTDIQNNPKNAAEITYALYFMDPGPPDVEVLIGAAERVPVNPTVGEYYAALMVPMSANVGTYRIRWTFREVIGGALLQVVQEFAVVAPSTVISSPYSDAEQDMIRTFRIMLRDNCVGGEEIVELDVNGERMIVRMEDLWEILCGTRMLSHQQRDKIRDAFQAGKLRIQSVSPEGAVAWKRVLHVQRASVPWETIIEGTTIYGPFALTAGHRVFLTPTQKKETQHLTAGDYLLGVDDAGSVICPQVKDRREAPSREFMYDLTAEDWHNFVLHRSRIVVSNSPDRNYHFRPPEHEADIGQYNRVFGYVWTDEELHVYLERALDWWNMFPPRTSIPNLERLLNQNAAWSTAIYYGGMSHALMALAINWVHDEFSVAGDTMVRVHLPDGRAVEMPIRELYDMVHEDN